MRTSYSQIKRAEDCFRKYAFGQADRPHRLYEPQKKSGEDGDDLHAANEGYVRYGLEFPDTRMGRLARLGAHHLPTRADMPLVEFEGVVTYGGHDLTARADLCWLAPCGPVIGDYKTCEHFGFALTPSKLRMDLQAVINCYYAMVKYDAEEATALWLYYRKPDPKKPDDQGEVRAVEALIEREGAKRVLRSRVALIDQMERYKQRPLLPLEVVGNPASCGNYGGCWYRHLCDPENYTLSEDGKKSVERGPVVEHRRARA